MAENDIVALKELASGGFLEVALAPSDIGAATSESTVAKAKALVDEFTGDPALIYTSEGSNGWTTLTDPASFRSALELSTSGNAAGLYDNIAGQVGAVVNDFSFRINGDGVSADFDTSNLTASRAYGLPNANGTLGLSEPADNVFRVVGSADATKKVAFEVDGLSSGTTRTLTVPDASGAIALTTLIGAPCEFIIACSDESTNLTTGTAKVTFRAPYAFTLTAVRASVNTAPTGSTLIVDINEGGSTVLSTKLSIDASEKTSTTAASAAVISDSAIADDAEITIDIDQIGSTIAGKGLKVTLIGTRA